MRSLTGISLITCLTLACGSGGDPGTDSHTNTAATESAATHASHTGAEGSTYGSTDGSTEGSTEGSTAGSTAATTTGVTTGATHEHGSSGAETGGGTPAEAYCACMLEHCHDQYHAKWGEDHHASEEMCAAEAGALPSVGMPATSGNSLECRMHYCELGHDDPAACDSAIGGGACV